MMLPFLLLASVSSIDNEGVWVKSNKIQRKGATRQDSSGKWAPLKNDLLLLRYAVLSQFDGRKFSTYLHDLLSEQDSYTQDVLYLALHESI